MKERNPGGEGFKFNKRSNGEFQKSWFDKPHNELVGEIRSTIDQKRAQYKKEGRYFDPVVLLGKSILQQEVNKHGIAKVPDSVIKLVTAWDAVSFPYVKYEGDRIFIHREHSLADWRGNIKLDRKSAKVLDAMTDALNIHHKHGKRKINLRKSIPERKGIIPVNPPNLDEYIRNVPPRHGSFIQKELPDEKKGEIPYPYNKNSEINKDKMGAVIYIMKQELQKDFDKKINTKPQSYDVSGSDLENRKRKIKNRMIEQGYVRHYKDVEEEIRLRHEKLIKSAKQEFNQNKSKRLRNKDSMDNTYIYEDPVTKRQHHIDKLNLLKFVNSMMNEKGEKGVIGKSEIMKKLYNSYHSSTPDFDTNSSSEISDEEKIRLIDAIFTNILKDIADK